MDYFTGGIWASQFAGSTAAVTTWNGRTGAVAPAAGDYEQSEITPNYTSFDNADKTVVSTDRAVIQIGTMSAPRAVTLPAASAVAAGVVIIIGDASGTVDQTNKLTITPDGADTINLVATEDIVDAYGLRFVMSDGVSNWASTTSQVTQATTLTSGRVTLSSGSKSLTDSANLTYAPTIGTGGLTVSNTTQATDELTGALIVSGGVGIAKSTWIAGNLDVSATTQSTSNNSGAIVSHGGLGVEKNAFIGGVLVAESTVSMTGPASVTDSTDSGSTTTGALKIGGGIGVVKGVTIGGHLTTAGKRVKQVTATAAAAGTTVIGATEHLHVVTGTNTETLTLPACATGREIIIKSRTTGSITVNRAGADTIDGLTSVSLLPGQSVTLIGNSTDWLII